MARKLKIDVVSDVVCPWCAIGMAGLDIALANLGGEIEADLAFHRSSSTQTCHPKARMPSTTLPANTASPPIRFARTDQPLLSAPLGSGSR